MQTFDFVKYLNLHGSQVRSVFGTWNTGLGRGDFLYLDYVLLNNPVPCNFLELGTGHGLSTCYLGVVAALRHGWVVTYDIQDLIPPHIRSVMNMLEIEPLLGDILENTESIGGVRMFIKNSEKGLCLFCDNGNKEKEIELYAPYLKQGDVLLVHDWGTEVHAENIAPYLVGYMPVAHEVAEAMQSHLRAWVKQ